MPPFFVFLGRRWCIAAADDPHGAGAEAIQRIAAPMVGGVLTSFLLELTVYPAIFALWKRRGLRADSAATAAAEEAAA